jgi:hypothetical protein
MEMEDLVMFRGLGRLALIAAALAVLLLPAGAGATEPISGSGSFTRTSVTVTSTTVTDDGSIIQTMLVSVTYTGFMDGTTEAEQRVVVHLDGVITVTTLVTFTGTVNGIAGTAVFRGVGHANAATGAFTGHFTFIDGTDGLTYLRGQGTIEGVGGSGAYAVNVHFDPAP